MADTTRGIVSTPTTTRGSVAAAPTRGVSTVKTVQPIVATADTISTRRVKKTTATPTVRGLKPPSAKVYARAKTSLTPIGYTDSGLPLVRYEGEKQVLNNQLVAQVERAKLLVAAYEAGVKLSGATARKAMKFGVSPFEKGWQQRLKATEEKYKEKRAKARKVAARKFANAKAYVWDSGAGKFIPTTVEQAKERAAFYRLYPEAGPAGTPGKISLQEAITKRQAESQAAFERRLQEEQPDLYSIYKTQGEIAYNRELHKREGEFKRTHTKLPDGQWVSTEQLNALPQKYRKLGKEKGYTAMVTALTAEQNRLSKIRTKLQEFRIKEPSAAYEYPEGGAPFEYLEGLEQYDIPAALRKGVKPEELQELFPPAVVKAAQDFNKQLEKGAKAEELYREKSYLYYDPKTGPREIGKEERAKVLADDPNARIVVQQPALVLPADPKWQVLKNRPKDDPERQAYVRKWQEKAIDFATYASLVATPYTMGAIGAVGKALTIPKVATWSFNIGRVGMKPLAIGATTLNGAVRTAVSLGKLTALGAPVYMAASRVVDQVRATQLQTDWDKLRASSPATKNAWADKAGYGKSFDQLTDEQKSVVLLHYSKPPDTTSEAWLSKVGESASDLNFYASQKAGWLQNKAPAPLALPATFLGGAAVGVLEGAGYMASIPMLAANLGAATVRGTGLALFTQTVRGMAEFFNPFTGVLRRAIEANPALAAGRITGLFLLSPQATLKLARGLGARSRFWRYIPERAMGRDFSTVRILFNKIAEYAKVPPKQRMRLTENAIKDLLDRKSKAKIGGSTVTIEIDNVPYQEVVGNTVWNFSDRPLETGSKVYASPQAAIRFGIATSGGKLVKGATLNEIRLPDKFQPKMEKLLSKGEAELEVIFGKNTVYEPIPGWTGKGVSSNVKTGPYPIRRFTIAGEKTTIKKLTPATMAKIRAKASQAAFGDLIKGWSGRAEALREMFRVDPRVNKLQASINRLKTEKPYAAIVDNVKTQRSSVPHPDFRGELKTRTKIIPYSKAGDAVFLGLDRSAPSYEFMGGSANPKEILLQSGKWLDFTKSKRRLDWGEAARSQVFGESNMRMPDTKYIGTYLGKLNDNALHGGRVYRGTVTSAPDIVAAWNKFQRGKFKYETPELKSGVWLYKDGTVKGVAGLKTSAAEAVRLFNELGVNPATKDILGYVAKKDGFRVDGVKVDRGNKWLLKTRDAKFANRATTGKPLTTKQVSNINKAEIKFLKRRRMDIAKGAEPMLMDYLTAEGELRTAAELLHGRRKAVTIKPNKPLRQRADSAIVELIKKDSTGKAKKARDLLEAGKTKDAIKAYERTMSGKDKTDLYRRLRDEIAAEVKEISERIYDNYGEYLYRPEAYSRQYATWLQRYTTAAAANQPLDLIRARRGETPAQLARVIVAAQSFDRPVIPPRVTGTRPGTPRTEPVSTTVRHVTPTAVERTGIVPSLPERGLPTRGEPLRVPPPGKTPSITPTSVPTPKKIPRPVDKGELPTEPPRIITPRADISGKRARLPEGSITYKQGLFWKYLPPPWTQKKLITLPASVVPIGAKKADARTAKDTVQMIGETRAKVPENVSVDLGPFDIHITDYGQNIDFTSGGMETNVGTRLASTTKGVSVPGTGVSRANMPKVIPARSTSRSAIAATTKPARVEQMTTVQTTGYDRPEVTKARRETAKARVESARVRQIEPDAKDLLYLDEDEEWLESLSPFGKSNKKATRSVNRAKMSKKKPRRRVSSRDNPPTMLGGYEYE